MASYFKIEERNGATHMTLDRGDEGNIISDEMGEEFAAALAEAGKTSRYIVFRTTGDDFCIGRDTAGVRGRGPMEALDLRDRNEVVFNCYNAFRRSPAPVITVVQGRALGFGCALATVSDITIAADNARFAFPEMGHNIMPLMAMSSGVDRMMRKALMYMIYSTEEIDADTALAYGLVSRVVPAAKLDDAVDTLLAAFDKAPTPALHGVKEYGAAAMTMDVKSATDFARNLHVVINSSSRMRP